MCPPVSAPKDECVRAERLAVSVVVNHLQHGKEPGRDGDHPVRARFRLLRRQQDLATRQRHLDPLQAQDLPDATARFERADDDAPEVRAGGRQKLRLLVRVQATIALPRRGLLDHIRLTGDQRGRSVAFAEKPLVERPEQPHVVVVRCRRPADCPQVAKEGFEVPSEGFCYRAPSFAVLREPFPEAPSEGECEPLLIRKVSARRR
jgi:hypothetical protein